MLASIERMMFSDEFCSLQSFTRLFFLSVVLFSIDGCSSEAKVGELVEGSVTVDSIPFMEGLIAFEPIKTTPGPKVTAEIVDGKFIIGPEMGLQAGEFRIEIMGIPPSVRSMAEGKSPSESDRKRYREIHADFNVRSNLKYRVKSGKVNYPSFDVRYRD
jgi:hypothetical protein